MIILSTFLFAIISLVAFWQAYPDLKTQLWPQFSQNKAFQHRVYFILITLVVIWSAQAGIKTGLSVHFLALTALTLAFGWRSAFILCLPACLGLILLAKLSIMQLPHYLVLSGLFPILISYAVFKFSYHYLPRNIFVFIFVAGFFNAGFTGSSHLVINALYQWLNGNYDWNTIYTSYLMLLPLLIFPEGLLNGMVIAVLVVFKPEWLRLFSDRDYLYHIKG